MAKRPGLADRSDAAKLDELVALADGSVQRGAVYKEIHSALTRRLEQLERDIDEAEADGKRALAAAEKEAKAALDAAKKAHAEELKAAQATLAAALKDRAESEKAAQAREAALKAKLGEARKAHEALVVEVNDFEKKLQTVASITDAKRNPRLRDRFIADEDGED